MIPPDDPVVLDTNVLVHLIRADAVGTTIQSELGLAGRVERPLIAIVTAGEIRSLALKFEWGTKKRRTVENLLGNLVIVHLFQGAIIEKYAMIDHHCEKVEKPARPVGQNDLWIAATTTAVEGWLVTEDSDFDHLGGRFFSLIRCDARNGQPIIVKEL